MYRESIFQNYHTGHGYGLTAVDYAACLVYVFAFESPLQLIMPSAHGCS